MDNKYEKYVGDLQRLGNEYFETSRMFNVIEKQVLKLRSDKDIVSARLADIREREKTLINKIEEETGEKISNDTIVEIIQNK
jgi:hypothetical protein